MAAKFLKYILFGIVFLFSLLPFFLIYRIADLLFVVVCYFPGYRRKVVANNLKLAFPEKSERERRKIAHGFYRSMTDIIVETFKMMTFSAEEIRRRIPFDSLTLYQKNAAAEKSCIVVYGHLGNWEWTSNAAGVQVPFKARGIYKPLSNKAVDELMKRFRGRHDVDLLPMQQAPKIMVRTRKEITATAFIADQKPHHQQAVWLEFLGQPTAFLQGAEKLAKMLDFPVIYIAVKRERRGYYRIHSEMITETPKVTAPGEITREFARRLERDIREAPSDWLWSHRRWSQRPPENWQEGDVAVWD